MWSTHDSVVKLEPNVLLPTFGILEPPNVSGLVEARNIKVDEQTDGTE